MTDSKVDTSASQKKKKKKKWREREKKNQKQKTHPALIFIFFTSIKTKNLFSSLTITDGKLQVERIHTSKTYILKVSFQS